ncbi:hypothetical protein BP6252_10702 [Coleophoma cylindrospora]|uniref:Uncharacterized protein n=1 Tax=Coleophoma cylindrospora TaxID=1849047 RepID=A0A3D8QTN8_9HELO|nr:hypothetical protein BP6252_10702 [Coleophoma cylindrospora]
MASITNKAEDLEDSDAPITNEYPDPEDCAPGTTCIPTWYKHFNLAQETRQPQPIKPILTPTSSPERPSNQASRKRKVAQLYGNAQQHMSPAASASSPLFRTPRSLKKVRFDSNPPSIIRGPPSTQASRWHPATSPAAATARRSAAQRSNFNIHRRWVRAKLPPPNAPRARSRPIFDARPPPKDSYVAFLTDEPTQRLLEEELAFLYTTDLLDPTYHYYKTYKSTYWTESYVSIIMDAMTCFYIHRYLYAEASCPTKCHKPRPCFPRRWKSLQDSGVVEFLYQDWYSWFEPGPSPGVKDYAWHIFGERDPQTLKRLKATMGRTD